MDKEKDPHDPDVHTAFLEYDRHVRVKNLKIGSVLIITLMPIGFSLDYFIYPEKLWFFLVLRLFCSLLAWIVWLLLTTPFGEKHVKSLGIVLPMLPVIFISWMIYETEGSASPYYAGLSLVLIAMGIILPWTHQENILAAALVITIYIGTCLLYGPIKDLSIFYNNLYFITLTALIVVVGSIFHTRLRRREFTYSFELDKSRQLLERTNRKLVELDQMKERFFANISHELRTPLTLILAPLELLRLDKGHLLPDEVLGELDIIEKNAVRLLKLIKDLLGLMKLESGKIVVKRAPLRVNEFLKGLVRSVEKMAEENGLTLELDLYDEEEPFLVDHDKFEKIVLNLLTNAIKFTPSGGRIYIHTEKEGETLVLIIRDTGIGISEKHLDRVFDRFWQGDSSSNGKYQGTGIGLAFVKELVETLGGQISVKSQPDQGTTMTIHLPAPAAPLSPLPHLDEKETSHKINSEEHFEPPQKEKAPDREIVRYYPNRANLSSLGPTPRSSYFMSKERRENLPRVLIAEDEPDMLQFLRSQLDRDFQVLEAVAGEETIDKAIRFLPDLILLDIMIPGKDGLQVCRELRINTCTYSIPIVILTARADQEAKLEALSSGASDFLTKPFSTTELQMRIWNLVQSYQLQRDLAKEKKTLETTLKQLRQTEVQLVQTEKMASLGKWSAGIIHEVNNPLNYSFSAIYMLKQRTHMLPKKEQRGFDEILQDIEEGMYRIRDTVTGLQDFVHPDSSQFDLVELDKAVETALKFVKDPWRTNVRIGIHIPKDQKVWGNKNALVHVFINLIQNALDALQRKRFEMEEPAIWIKSRLEEEKVLMTIRDNGEGIAPEHINRIFDPFFTTRDVGEGMGLGLGICYGIIRQHGGTISVKSETGKFTEFDLKMPLKEEEQMPMKTLEGAKK